MKRIAIAGAAALFALTACSQGAEYAEDAAYEKEVAAVEMSEASAEAAAESGVSPANIPVSLPKIAYIYEYGFRIAADTIPDLQRKHADLCEKQGPQYCRILEMQQSGSEGDYASGSLELAVAAPRARAFGSNLTKLADEAGGKAVSSGISGEDLSKQIVDTEARLRARTVLRNRLMEVLASRKGTVAELVEAERGVAQVNEEIDQASSWLAEMQGRVDFSRVNINYASGSPSGGGFMEPIRGAIGSIGTILGTVFAVIIVLLTILVPVGLVCWGLWALFRRIRPKKRPSETNEEGAD
ncbi:MAG: DUF4349 domain-containing protein [Novosphingobium sp.]|nr:DUF4349 domain-containing protein [Novosphingobium sp.]